MPPPAGFYAPSPPQVLAIRSRCPPRTAEPIPGVRDPPGAVRGSGGAAPTGWGGWGGKRGGAAPPAAPTRWRPRPRNCTASLVSACRRLSAAAPRSGVRAPPPAPGRALRSSPRAVGTSPGPSAVPAARRALCPRCSPVPNAPAPPQLRSPPGPPPRRCRRVSRNGAALRMGAGISGYKVRKPPPSPLPELINVILSCVKRAYKWALMSSRLRCGGGEGSGELRGVRAAAVGAPRAVRPEGAARSEQPPPPSAPRTEQAVLKVGFY